MAMGSVLSAGELASLRDDVCEKINAFFKNIKIDGPGKEKEQEAALSELVPVAVELTNACDYSQGNIRVYRFVCGYMIPDSHIANGLVPKDGPTNRKLSPIFHDGKFYTVVFSSRHLVSLALDTTVTPMMRLREQVVKDMQAWLSSHIGRVGFLALNLS